MDASIPDSGSIDTLHRCEATEYIGRAKPHGVHGGDPVSVLGGLFSTTVPPRSVTAFVHEAGSPWPTADLLYEDVGLTVTFDASGSTPGTIERYEWDFGDGTGAEVVSPVHAYATAGTYDVILTVTEAMGGVDTVSAAVT